MRLKNIGRYERELIGRFGRIKYSRSCLAPADEESAALLWELEKRKSIFPLDSALGVDNLPFKVTPSMMCEIARFATKCKSFVEATDAINEMYNINISEMMVERITGYVGELVFQDQERLAYEAKRQFDEGVVVNGRYSGGTVYLFMDGAMCNIRDKPHPKEKGKTKAGWMESKHALAFHSSKVKYYKAKNGEIEHRIQEKEFIGIIGYVAEFTPFFLLLAKMNGCDHCNVVVISDGAKWIQNLVKQYLPNAIYILDLYHAKENADKFANAVIRGKNKKKAFADKLCKLIDEGKVNELLKVLDPYKDIKMPDGVVNMYTFVQNHANCMDYPTYRKMGYFVGSGAIESGNKQLMQNRMKLQGMQWKHIRANWMLALKGRYESGRWEDVKRVVFSHFYDSIVQGSSATFDYIK